MLFPSKRVYIRIEGVGLDIDGVKIIWKVRTNDYNAKLILTRQPMTIEDFLIAFFAAILGDGSITIVKSKGKEYPEMYLSGSRTKIKWWLKVLKSLDVQRSIKSITWHEYDVDYETKRIVLYSSSVKNFLRMVYDIITAKSPMLLGILNILAELDAEKLRRFNKTLTIDMRRKGGSSVLIGGVRFTVRVAKSFSLRCYSKDNRCIEALRLYGVDVNNHSNEVIVPEYIIDEIVKKDNDVRRQLIEILCHKYEEADNEKKQRILKLLMKYAPTKGAAAVSVS